MTLAILCSGQGNQHQDMFALTAAAPPAAEIFAIAAKLLDGRDPRELVRDPEVDFHSNRIGQILCCTQALAAWAALNQYVGARFIVAGYSIGEIASWGIAGALTPEAVLHAAAKRADAMDAVAGPNDGLAHIRGLARTEVEALCRDNGTDIAIVNPGDLFVIGGTREGLANTVEAAKQAGAAQTGILQVAVASHTPRMRDASDGFQQVLSELPVAAPPFSVRLLSGIDASQVRDTTVGLDKLARQISQTIDWAGCLNACGEAGATMALELGPGHALSNMTTSALPAINSRSLDDFRSLDGVAHWLKGAGG